MEEISIMIAGKLKELYNIAYAMIAKKNYEKAKDCYENAAQLCSVIQYSEGSVMAWISLANLYMLQQEDLKAFEYGRKAEEGCKSSHIVMEPEPEEFLRKLSKRLLQQGISLEQKNKLVEAYQIYEMILPYLNERNRGAVEQEMKLIRLQKSKEIKSNG